MDKGVIKAKIKSQPKTGESKSGNRSVNFAVEAKKGDMVPCSAWESMIGQEDLERLAACSIGTGIVMRGFESDEGVYVIKWFALEGEKAGEEVSERERIFSYYGNERRFREMQQEHLSQMEAKGFVAAHDEAGKFFMEKKDRCVFNEQKHCWVRKIDFCMDLLGPAEVTRRLKTLPGGADIKLGNIKGFPVKEYKALLESMLEEALSKSETVLPHHSGSISSLQAPGDMLEPF